MRLLEYLYQDPGVPPEPDYGRSCMAGEHGDPVMGLQTSTQTCDQEPLEHRTRIAALSGYGVRFSTNTRPRFDGQYDGTVYDEREAVQFRHFLSETWAEDIKKRLLARDNDSIPTMWMLEDRMRRLGHLRGDLALTFFCPVYFAGQQIVKALLNKKDENGELIVFSLPSITDPERIQIGLAQMLSLGIENPERHLKTIDKGPLKGRKALRCYSMLPGAEGVASGRLYGHIAMEAVQLGAFMLVPRGWVNAGDPYNQSYRFPGEEGYSPYWRIPPWEEFKKMRPKLASGFKKTNKGVVRRAATAKNESIDGTLVLETLLPRSWESTQTELKTVTQEVRDLLSRIKAGVRGPGSKRARAELRDRHAAAIAQRKKLEAHAQTFPEYEVLKRKRREIRGARMDSIMQRQAREDELWKAAQPRIEKLRSELIKSLRGLGFKQEFKSKGSQYFVLQNARDKFSTTPLRVRVSDHQVPMTGERQHAIDTGGFTWAEHGWNFVVDPDTDRRDMMRQLAGVRRAVRDVQEHCGTPVRLADLLDA